MEDCYRNASKFGHVEAMVCLADYFRHSSAFEDMEHFYLMAIEKGSCVAMNKLAAHCLEIRKYPDGIRYYQMAVDMNNDVAMLSLGVHFYHMQDVPNMRKYIEMAIECGNVDAMNYYADYFERIGSVKDALRFYLRAKNERKINEILSMRKSVEHFKNFTKCREMLDKENTKFLNDTTAFLLSIKVELRVEKCDICFEKKEALQLHCKHKLCNTCYKNNLSKTPSKCCPFCRATI